MQHTCPREEIAKVRTNAEQERGKRIRKLKSHFDDMRSLSAEAIDSAEMKSIRIIVEDTDWRQAKDQL